MTTKPDIKILVVNHKPSFVPKNNLLKPIQVGATIASKKLDNMAYYDDSGDNISDKNRSYCELTATYWAWKNLDADYYGLFHYRRYFSFAPDREDNPYPGKSFPDIESALPEVKLDEASMRKMIERYDLVIPRKDSALNTTGHKSIYEQYKSEHNIDDLDYCLAYIKDTYPEIAPFTEVLHDSEGYFCNMFIMKKTLFNDYCRFMFDVLSSFDEHNDISTYNVHQYRVDGFLAERLTNIYINYLQSLGKHRVKELQVAYFENTDPKQTLRPVAKENNVAIVLAANNYYVPYISTLLHSVAKHSSDDHSYDITIFHRDITPDNMALLKSEFASRANFSIRFYDMSYRASEYEKLFTKLHFTVETYFRLFIQDIMTEYHKVLYLDGDMIVRADVAELYNENVDGKLLAACIDPDTAGLYNGFEPQKKEYMDMILKIKKPYDYFQAGVILFNLDEMRKTLDVKELMDFASSYKWELLDQDVLNYIAQGKVKFVDMSWNVMYDWRNIRLSKIVSLAPIELYLAYVTARQHPRIVHYAGPEKPWQDMDCDYAPYYWEVARKSIYYELILSRMVEWRSIHRWGTTKQKVSFLRKGVHRLRKTADKVAPVGSNRRKPITLMSKITKKILYIRRK